MRYFGCLSMLALSACAPRYEASEEITMIPAPAGAEVVGQDIVTIRAFYTPDISLAELGDAQCRVSAGGASVTITTPAQISVPKRTDAQQKLEARCKVQIGPRIAEDTVAVNADAITAENAERTRQYPPEISARF